MDIKTTQWSVYRVVAAALFCCALFVYGAFLLFEPQLISLIERSQAAALHIFSQEPRSEDIGTLALTPFNTTSSPKTSTKMKMTFHDEFNALSRYLDANGNVSCASGGKGTWQTVYNFCSRTQFGNNEEQVYTDPGFLAYLKKESATSSEVDPDNPFSVSRGVLAIKAAPSSLAVQKAAGSWAKYTSGLITTQFSFTQTYGYFEARMKVPAGAGLWPAFWLLPIDETWPPEIDAMETFGDVGVTGEGGRSKIHYASHALTKDASCGVWYDAGVDLTSDFHVYGVNVEQDVITYYLDRKPYAVCQANPDAHKPFYMLLNLAVGGWPGSPTAQTKWPAYLYIDYVRAYQKI